MATEEMVEVEATNGAAEAEGVQDDRDNVTEQVTLEVSCHRTHSGFHFHWVCQ